MLGIRHSGALKRGHCSSNQGHKYVTLDCIGIHESGITTSKTGRNCQGKTITNRYLKTIAVDEKNATLKIRAPLYSLGGTCTVGLTGDLDQETVTSWFRIFVICWFIGCYLAVVCSLDDREKMDPPSLSAKKHPHGMNPGRQAHPTTNTARQKTLGNDNSSWNRQTRSQQGTVPDKVPGK